MTYIIVDLEMNPIPRYKPEYSVCRNEIIEIGAIALNDQFEEVDFFKTLVKPSFTRMVTRTVKYLTGITTKMLNNASDFSVALRAFLDWCTKGGQEYTIIQWGSNDMSQIQQEIKLKSFTLTPKEKEMLENWHDLQKEFCDYFHMETAPSLFKAIYIIGKEPVGSAHCALADARNAATIFRDLRNNRNSSMTAQGVITALYDKPFTVSLGELFDFSQLHFIADTQLSKSL